jgi:hypothetical protein
VSLEGELRVRLQLLGGRIAGLRITSTRPDVARALLQGRTRADVSAAVPLLFSICARSQAAASTLACAAAAGEDVTPEALARCSAAVSAETVRECAWRSLLDWPQWMGETPTDDAVLAARSSLAFQLDEPAGQAVAAIAQAAFGIAADEWLAIKTLPELDRWIDAGVTATARFIRSVRDEDAEAHDDKPRPPPWVAWLTGGPHEAWAVELSQACDRDPGFARQPTWRGAPVETGALARLQDDPLIGGVLQRSASRVPARFVARLRELAQLLAGRASAAVGTATLPSGGGIAWVENARGLLVHRVRLAGDRVASYGIVAPTEWNFHPSGAMASALLNAAAGSAEDARRSTSRLVNSLDPCVACRVEFDDA